MYEGHRVIFSWPDPRGNRIQSISELMESLFMGLSDLLGEKKMLFYTQPIRVFSRLAVLFVVTMVTVGQTNQSTVMRMFIPYLTIR